MSAFLIRHAHAGSRSSWDEPDELRPLSEKGHTQARYLAELLAGRPITRVFSSPAVRCVETAQPLAAEYDLQVEEVTALFEGQGPTLALDLMHEHAGAGAAFCSHGDLIPEVIRLLQMRGMRITGENASTKKGSVWQLEIEGHDFVSATYHPPL